MSILPNPEERYPDKDVTEVARVFVVGDDLHAFLLPTILEEASASADCHMWGDIAAQIIHDAAHAIAEFRGADPRDCMAAILRRCEASLADTGISRSQRPYGEP